MKTPIVKPNWAEQKAELKQRFTSLTDNDLLFDEGGKAAMLEKLELMLGKTKEEINEFLKGT